MCVLTGERGPSRDPSGGEGIVGIGMDSGGGREDRFERNSRSKTNISLCGSVLNRERVLHRPSTAA
jgi:hypothetical protein